MNKTKINWCDVTWNPISGCSKIAQGCKFCYAETIANRFWKDRKFTDVQFHPERLNDPKLRSKKPLRIFVNSMSDLFHEKISFDIIDEIFQVISNHQQHTFLILTKRIKRVVEWQKKSEYLSGGDYLPNVWLGYSASTQKDLDDGIDYLHETDAKIKWLSLEPLIEYMDLYKANCIYSKAQRVDWVVIGCESGNKRRDFKNYWANDLVADCQSANVPVWVKQIRDERNNVIEDVNLFPKELQLRQLPENK